jgi:hypothetical protein
MKRYGGWIDAAINVTIYEWNEFGMQANQMTV